MKKSASGRGLDFGGELFQNHFLVKPPAFEQDTPCERCSSVAYLESKARCIHAFRASFRSLNLIPVLLKGFAAKAPKEDRSQ
jgi:hypothetical protein